MKKKKKKKLKAKGVPGQVQLPKDAIRRVNLGQAFAEYDQILQKNGVFVTTPALEAALDTTISKCFFVGRRGTGKTAITYFLSANQKNAVKIHPQVLSPILFSMPPEHLRDAHQRPFRSLVEAFKRALIDEVLSEWINRELYRSKDLPHILNEEMRITAQYDFDLRVLLFMENICAPLLENDEKKWLRHIGRSKRIGKAMAHMAEHPKHHFTLLIDRVDESWDGSDTCVIMLMALMHACIELLSTVEFVRPLLFLRENVFDRVRQIDHESTRLETCVVSMDWTQELLLEMIERRLNLPFHTKPALHGPTWNYFFDNTDEKSSQSLVFEYCQERPRDILTYCEFALERAKAKRHPIVRIDDLLDARRQYSESRLKDLA